MSNQIEPTREDLIAEELINSLNSKEKLPIAYNLESDISPAKIKFWIPTGSPVLDMIISNQKNGGWPSGRIILLEGMDSSGKSLLAAHALAAVQKMGGLGVFIDSETAVSPEFLKAIGVDLNKLIYISTNDTKKAFETMEHVIRYSVEKKFNKPIVFVKDSITATTLPEYLKNPTNPEGYEDAKKAQYISNQLKKFTKDLGMENICVILTAQLRANMSPMPGADHYTLPGGFSLKFYPSLRIRLKKKGLIRDKDSDDAIGAIIEAETLKNRICGIERRKTRLYIKYSSGLDSFDTVINEATDLGIIETKGAWKAFGDVKFQSKTVKEVVTDEIFEQILNKIAEKKLKKYNYEDVLIEEKEDEENS